MSVRFSLWYRGENALRLVGLFPRLWTSINMLHWLFRAVEDRVTKVRANRAIACLS